MKSWLINMAITFNDMHKKWTGLDKHSSFEKSAGRLPKGDKKRILFVAPEFPPRKTIGRLRPLKFCLHLQDFGWECFVLTLPNVPFPDYDPETLNEIPKGVKVFRAKPLQPEEQFISPIINFLKNIFRNDKQSNATDIVSGMDRRSNSHAPGGAHSLLNKLGSIKGSFDKFLYRNVLIPDNAIGWFFPAIKTGMKICREYDIDIIFTTAPPFTDFLIGWHLKLRTGLPWIADYRDLWSGDVLREWVPAWRKRIEIVIEKKLLAKADAIISVSEPKTEVLKNRITKLDNSRFYTITNGYDPEEYQDFKYAPNGNGKVRFVYTGRLFKNRRGYEFVEAAGKLLEEHPELKPRLQVEYYGGVAPEIKARLDVLVQRHALREQFLFYPDVPYAQAKALQVGADILLLIVDTGETTSGVIPGKLFEYIAARRPVFCIAAPGATPELIETGKLGWVLSPGDVDGIKEAMKNLLCSSGDIVYEPDESFLQHFERRKLTQRLNKILSEKAMERANIA